jgi:hypothetical protein
VCSGVDKSRMVQEGQVPERQTHLGYACHTAG